MGLAHSRHSINSCWLGPFVYLWPPLKGLVLGVPLLPAPPIRIPLWAPLFLLPKRPLSRRIFHKKLFGSVLPALQDEPDVLPGFASVAGFYDDLIGCGGKGGRESAEGKQHPPSEQEQTGHSLQVLHPVLDHSLKGVGVGRRLKSLQLRHYK